MISIIVIWLFLGVSCNGYSDDNLLGDDNIMCYECNSVEDEACVIDSQNMQQLQTVECTGLCFNSTATTVHLTSIEVRGCIPNVKSCDIIKGCRQENGLMYCYSCCGTNLCNNADMPKLHTALGIIQIVTMYCSIRRYFTST